MKRLIPYLFFFFICSSIFGAADYFMPDRIGISAKSIRIGGIESFDDTSASIFGNPAGLYRVSNFSLSMFSTTIMDEVDYRNVSFAISTPLGTLGVGYFMQGVDDIPLTTSSNTGGDWISDIYVEEIGSFSYKNNMLKLALQFSQTEMLHFGISGVYYSNEIYNVTGSGYNMDLGLILDADPLAFSLHLKNIMSSEKITYSNNGHENLSLQSFYSLRYNLNELRAFAQMKILGSNQRFVKSFGLQYSPSFAPFIFLSGGFKEDYVLTDIVSRVTGGVGLSLFGIQFDYAYEESDHIEFDNKHYFSFGISY